LPVQRRLDLNQPARRGLSGQSIILTSISSIRRNWPRLTCAAGNTRLKTTRGPRRRHEIRIFYELQLPRLWEDGDELRLYQNALTQLETADRSATTMRSWNIISGRVFAFAGAESFLAAASQRTRKIWLGHGIFQLTTNHPARVAERVAVLDLLSNGRCEFGMGETITELTPFGRDMETKKEVFEEAVQAIFPMFTKVGTEHHGKYFDIPLRTVCRSRCRSRIRHCGWRACNCQPSNAGQHGFGALGFQFVSADAAHAWVHAYQAMRSPSA
jgi:alkanesulfonate monooxygenase SsuD/methylene tetrahydromethanopterin reductase-like flavin-dependent oxidoreductase (luciferase family)